MRFFIVCLVFSSLLISLLSISVEASFFNKNFCTESNPINDDTLSSLFKLIKPDLKGKHKGETGRIVVIGGSSAYTGAPYFAGITALKVGADLVKIVTTGEAAPVIKSYSPDLIVIPDPSPSELFKILEQSHVVIIGPGLGREQHSMDYVYRIIDLCRSLNKPLVIDADGLYAISKNLTVIRNYPSPGVILTPNHVEANRLKLQIPLNAGIWSRYWGLQVTVLEKGEEDQFHSIAADLEWKLSKGGSRRRCGGQGDILAGALATFYNWAINSDICNSTVLYYPFRHSVASYAAAKLTRDCNSKAYKKYGFSMIASDMLNEIHNAFHEMFYDESKHNDN